MVSAFISLVLKTLFQMISLRTCAWIFDDDQPCGNLCEGTTNFCSSHNRQLRREKETTQKQSSKRVALLSKMKEKNKQPRQKVKKVSDKRAVLNEEYSKLAIRFKEVNPFCKGKIPKVCTGKTEHVHHAMGRGKYLLDPETWIPLCAGCHFYVHQYPLDAMKRGLSFSRLATQKQTI